MLRLLFVLLLSLFLKTTTGYFQNDTQMVHHRLELKYFNPNYLKNVKISMIPLNRKERALNGTLDLLVDLRNTLPLTMEAFKAASNEYRLFPFRYGIDICNLLNEYTFGFFEIKKFSNFHPCPLKKGSYYIRKYKPDESQYPPNLIPGDYKIVANMTQDSVKLLEFHWYGSVKSVEKLWRN